MYEGQIDPQEPPVREDGIVEDYSQQQYADDAGELQHMRQLEMLAEKPQFECNKMCISDFVDVPDHSMLCPITRLLMNDPVVAADGMTYERTAIRNWILSQKDNPSTRIGSVCSPVTGEELSNLEVIDNNSMKSMTSTFKDQVKSKNPELVKAIEEHNKMGDKANEELKKGRVQAAGKGLRATHEQLRRLRDAASEITRLTGPTHEQQRPIVYIGLLRNAEVRTLENAASEMRSLTEQNSSLCQTNQQLRTSLGQRNTSLDRTNERLRTTLGQRDEQLRTLESAWANSDAELRRKTDQISQLTTNLIDQTRLYEDSKKNNKQLEKDLQKQNEVNVQVIEAICAMANGSVDAQVCLITLLTKFTCG